MAARRRELPLAASVAFRVFSESQLPSNPRSAPSRASRAGGLLSCNHGTLANLRQLKTQNPKLNTDSTPPSPTWNRAGAGPLTPFSSLRIVGMTTRSIPPCSGRRNDVIGPPAARSRRLRFAPAPRGAAVRSQPRGRRRAYGAHGSPRFRASAAVRDAPRSGARQRATISRRLAFLATNPFARRAADRGPQIGRLSRERPAWP